MKFIKIEFAALTAFILCFILSVTSLDKKCEGIRSSVLRLHVTAASDSEKDQQMKLRLRDELLSKGSEIFSQSSSKAEAEEKIAGNLSFLQQSAEDFLEAENYPYSVTVSLSECYFPTRTYEAYTLPAGIYDAVKVTIGEGKGQNWWCVMFPSLCLPAAKEDSADIEDVLTKDQLEIVTSDKYIIRLWIIEKWQEFVADRSYK